MEVALRTPKWANDDGKFVEFLSNLRRYDQIVCSEVFEV